MSIVSVTLVDLWCVISSFTFTLSSSCCVSSRFVMVRRQGTLKVGSRNSISLMKAGTSTMDIGSMHLPIRLPMRSEMRSERLSVIGRALNAVIFGCGLLDLAVDTSKTVGCLLRTCRIGADVLPPVHASSRLQNLHLALFLYIFSRYAHTSERVAITRCNTNTVGVRTNTTISNNSCRCPVDTTDCDV